MKRASRVSTSGVAQGSQVVTVVATRQPEAPASEVVNLVMDGKHGVARGKGNMPTGNFSSEFCLWAAFAQRV